MPCRNAWAIKQSLVYGNLGCSDAAVSLKAFELGDLANGKRACASIHFTYRTVCKIDHGFANGDAVCAHRRYLSVTFHFFGTAWDNTRSNRWRRWRGWCNASVSYWIQYCRTGASWNYWRWCHTHITLQYLRADTRGWRWRDHHWRVNGQ